MTIMYSISIGLLAVFIGLALAGPRNQAHLDFKVRRNNGDTSESIDINYRNNYVMISTPAHQRVRPVVMLHDYNQGVNILKRNGNCFVLDQFDGVPDDIRDWERLTSAQTGPSIGLGRQEAFRNYKFRALRFFVDRSTLPQSVQRICSGPIKILILEDILENKGADTDSPPEEDGDYSEIFLPGRVVTQTSRVKRQLQTGPLFDASLSLQERPKGPLSEWFNNNFQTGKTWDGHHTLQTLPNSNGWFGGVEGRWDGNIWNSPIGVNVGRETGNFRWDVGAGSDLSGNAYGRVGFTINW